MLRAGITTRPCGSVGCGTLCQIRAVSIRKSSSPARLIMPWLVTALTFEGLASAPLDIAQQRAGLVKAALPLQDIDIIETARPAPHRLGQRPEERLCAGIVLCQLRP